MTTETTQTKKKCFADFGNYPEYYAYLDTLPKKPVNPGEYFRYPEAVPGERRMFTYSDEGYGMDRDKLIRLMNAEVSDIKK